MNHNLCSQVAYTFTKHDFLFAAVFVAMLIADAFTHRMSYIYLIIFEAFNLFVVAKKKQQDGNSEAWCQKQHDNPSGVDSILDGNLACRSIPYGIGQIL